MDAHPVVIADDDSDRAGRSRAVAAVLGSTAEGILRHAHRPVLVVPDT
jgi:nucleotide-binding universal stress UspA family protein